MRKTKIIGTLGPASSDYKTFKNLVLAGLNVARINLSHGDVTTHQQTVDTVKQVRSELNMPVSIMIDTRGPEVRVQKFEGGSTTVKTGKFFMLYNHNVVGTEAGVSVTEPNCLKDVPLNTTILANDGLLVFRVAEKCADGLKLKVAGLVLCSWGIAPLSAGLLCYIFMFFAKSFGVLL